MKKLKILFFGRKNDNYSTKCLDHLNNLNFDVIVILSKKEEKNSKKYHLKTLSQKIRSVHTLL